MRRLVMPLVLILAGTAAGFAMVEGVLRLAGFYAPTWYAPDAQLGWRLRPLVSGWQRSEGNAWVETNAAGQRDRVHTLERPAATYRIAVLGDSYAEAMQVDMKDAFWHVLEQQLNACRFRPGETVEVINFGVSGYGTAQEYRLLENDAERYKPDLVLLAFTNGNDLRNNSKELEVEKDQPFYTPGPHGLVADDSFRETDEFRKRSSSMREFERTLSDHLRTFQLAHRLQEIAMQWKASGTAQAAGPGQQAEPGLDYAVLAPPRNRAWEQAWTVTDALILNIGEHAATHGEAFVVVPVTAAVQVDPDREVRQHWQQVLGVEDLFYIERRLEPLSRLAGGRLIPLADELQRRAEADRVYFHGFANSGLGKGHWNEAGHRAAAGIVARDLCARPPS